MEASFWTAEEIDLHQDLTDWNDKLNADVTSSNTFLRFLPRLTQQRSTVFEVKFSTVSRL